MKILMMNGLEVQMEMCITKLLSGKALSQKEPIKNGTLCYIIAFLVTSGSYGVAPYVNFKIEKKDGSKLPKDIYRVRIRTRTVNEIPVYHADGSVTYEVHDEPSEYIWAEDDIRNKSNTKSSELTFKEEALKWKNGYKETAYYAWVHVQNTRDCEF